MAPQAHRRSSAVVPSNCLKPATTPETVETAETLHEKPGYWNACRKGHARWKLSLNAVRRPPLSLKSVTPVECYAMPCPDTSLKATNYRTHDHENAGKTEPIARRPVEESVETLQYM